jgi:hypothetical protein
MLPELKIDYMKYVGATLVIGVVLLVPGVTGMVFSVGRSKIFAGMYLMGRVLFTGALFAGLLGLFIY